MVACTTRAVGNQFGLGLAETTMRAAPTALVSIWRVVRPSTVTSTSPACAGRRIATTRRGAPIVFAPRNEMSSLGASLIVLRTATPPATAVQRGCVALTVSAPPRSGFPAIRTGSFGTTRARNVTSCP
jgi:hypothetical protein